MRGRKSGFKHSEKTKEKIRARHLGKRMSKKTEFKKGDTPWNKGMIGENNKLFRGEEITAIAKHTWITKHYGSPSKCDICGTTKAKRFEWSNKKHHYTRDIKDYQRLCKSCHIKYDMEYNGYLPNTKNFEKQWNRKKGSSYKM